MVIPEKTEETTGQPIISLTLNERQYALLLKLGTILRATNDTIFQIRNHVYKGTPLPPPLNIGNLADDLKAITQDWRQLFPQF